MAKDNLGEQFRKINWLEQSVKASYNGPEIRRPTPPRSEEDRLADQADNIRIYGRGLTEEALAKVLNAPSVASRYGALTDLLSLNSQLPPRDNKAWDVAGQENATRIDVVLKTAEEKAAEILGTAIMGTEAAGLIEQMKTVMEERGESLTAEQINKVNSQLIRYFEERQKLRQGYLMWPPYTILIPRAPDEFVEGKGVPVTVVTDEALCSLSYSLENKVRQELSAKK